MAEEKGRRHSGDSDGRSEGNDDAPENFGSLTACFAKSTSF
jgi:hypothetical protein